MHTAGIAWTLALAAGSAGPAAADADALWRQALALAAANASWTPGSTQTRVETRNARGELERVDEVWARRADEAAAGVEWRLVRHLRDGTDVTASQARPFEAEQRKRAQKKKKDGRDDDFDPFAPHEQAGLTVRAGGESRRVGGRTCHVLLFSRPRAARKGVTGSACLEAGSGAPLEAEFTLDPLPTGVRRLAVRVRYAFVSPQEWYAVEIEADGAASWLFVKKAFHTATVLAEHRRRGAVPAAGPPAVTSPTAPAGG